MLSVAKRDISLYREAGSIVEQSSSEIWNAVCAIIREVIQTAGVEPEQVVGLGFDATCSLVVLGEGGKPLAVGPSEEAERDIIVWMDHRAVAQAERINAMFDYTNEVRGFKNEGWENYRNMLLSTYPQRGAEVNHQHAARQAYIGMSASIIAAAFEEVDSTPMEGFDPAALDEILGLRAKGLRSVIILPLGYREEDKDWLVNLKKVRRPNPQFVSEVK